MHRFSSAPSRIPLVSLVWILAAPVAALGQTPGLVFERLIGCELCEGPEQFRSIQSLFVEGDRVVVTDGDAPHVRVFPLADGSPEPVRALGPEGDGPGELRTPLNAFLHEDGALTVIDLGQKRVTRFASDDAVLETRPFQAFPAGAGYATDVDRLLLTTTDFQGGLTLVRLAESGGLDTVLARVPFQNDGVMRFTSPAVRDDGAFAVGEGWEEYLIHVYGPDGELRRTLRRDVERRPRTADEIAALRDRIVLRGGGRRRAEGGREPAEPEIDPLQPHFRQLSALQFDERGRLWVRTSRAEAGRTVFDVFGPDFSYLGEVGIDRELGVYAVRDGWLAAGTEGELDIPRIGVWRVVD